MKPGSKILHKEVSRVHSNIVDSRLHHERFLIFPVLSNLSFHWKFFAKI